MEGTNRGRDFKGLHGVWPERKKEILLVPHPRHPYLIFLQEFAHFGRSSIR